MENRQVIIVGGGPVGLMLACELGLRGIDTTVLERRTDIDQTIKAGAINTPTAEAFYRRGLGPALARAHHASTEAMASFIRARIPPGTPMPPMRRPLGHFAGIWTYADAVDLGDRDFTAAGPAADSTLVRQQEIEAVLGTRAAELGVDLRRGATVTGLDIDTDCVRVHAGDDTLRADWLVGCDGGRSQVRKRAGFDFPGTDGEISGHQAVVTMDGADALQPGWNRTPNGIYVNGPTPGRVLTVELGRSGIDRDEPVTAAELQASLRRVSGVDVTVTGMRSATRFTDNARQATSYRLGRVLLAGDAAHVHSPFGGQGLNLGIGDAMNLGWKLAAVVSGDGPPDLLDSYTAERHPIGEWVLQWSRAQVALMRLDPGTNALRDVVGDLIDTRDGATYFAKKLAGVAQRYDLGDDHPMVGRSAPDLRLEHDGQASRLGQHLHAGNGLLLELVGPDGPVGPSGLRAAAATVPAHRLHHLIARCPDRPDLAALLVRPDGCVAWALNRANGDGTDPADALAAWFGVAQKS